MKKYLHMGVGIVALIVGTAFYIMDKIGIAPTALDDSGEILGFIGTIYASWKAGKHGRNQG